MRLVAATIAPNKLPARSKLLRQHFESTGVRRTSLFDARHYRLLILYRHFQPVHAGRGPGDGDLAILVGLESHLFGCVAVSRAPGDDLDLEIRGGLAIEQETKLRRFTRI